MSEFDILKKLIAIEKEIDILKSFEVPRVSTVAGVTNGNLHDHIGGDGAQIDHGGLAGLADDDHAQYLLADGTRAAARLDVVGSGISTEIQMYDQDISGANYGKTFLRQDGNVLSIVARYADNSGSANLATASYANGWDFNRIVKFTGGVQMANAQALNWLDSAAALQAVLKLDASNNVILNAPYNAGASLISLTVGGIEVARVLYKKFVFNEAAAVDIDFRAESATEPNMIFLDSNADTDGALYLGGLTNGVKINKGGVFSFIGTSAVKDATNIPLGSTTGTKLGTASTQKLGLWNVTPIVQPSAAAYTTDPESSAYTGAADGEAKLTDLNALRVAYENLRASHDDLLAKLKTTGIIA